MPLHHKHRARIKKGFWLMLGFIFFGAIMAGTVFMAALSDLPSLDLLQNRQVSESTKIYDRTGTILLYEIYGEERRTVIPFEKIPEHVKEAAIAIEDSGFYTHSAVDFSSLLRALLVNLKSGSVQQGGSTITQQLAKKAFLSDERTYTRKIKEVIIAYKLERTFTKDQILELYLNQIPYGSNAYGIESAAQTYFQRSPMDLTLAQTALLAALPQAPSYYSPFGSHVNELLTRKNLVLEQMAKLGYITEQQRATAAAEELKFSKNKSLQRAPHFVLEVKQYLDDQYGEDFVARAGLKVTTTLDADMQEIAEKAVVAGAARNTELYKGTNAALVAQDPKTGQILALVGSRNFFDEEIDGQFNVASQGLRQPGSALKPLIYMKALEKGYPPETLLFDVPTEFYPNNAVCPSVPNYLAPSTPDSKCFHPQNYDERFVGPVNLRSALAQSRNVPAVKVLYLVGLSDAVAFMQKLGLATLNDASRYGLSLVLGGGEVRLQDLVGAYSVLAQEGVRHEQSLILSVTDQSGKALEQYQDIIDPIIDPQYPRIINDILSDKEARAPLFSSSLNLTVFPGYDVALKTGTTNDYRDAWSVGYTPSIVVGVWAGNNDNKPMEKRGGSILAAVPILNAFLREALPMTPSEPFTAPEPMPVSKPMLNGQYITAYQAGGQLFQEVHDILYYVNRADPLGPPPSRPDQDSQFANWEQAAITWASANIPGFLPSLTYNRTLPPGAVVVDTTASDEAGSVIIISPSAGEFIKNGQLLMNAQIRSQKEIIKIEVFFNNAFIDVRSGSLGSSPTYQASFATGAANPQNILKITATDITGVQFSKEVIVYR